MKVSVISLVTVIGTITDNTVALLPTLIIKKMKAKFQVEISENINVFLSHLP